MVGVLKPGPPDPNVWYVSMTVLEALSPFLLCCPFSAAPHIVHLSYSPCAVWASVTSGYVQSAPTPPPHLDAGWMRSLSSFSHGLWRSYLYSLTLHPCSCFIPSIFLVLTAFPHFSLPLSPAAFPPCLLPSPDDGLCGSQEEEGESGLSVYIFDILSLFPHSLLRKKAASLTKPWES